MPKGKTSGQSPRESVTPPPRKAMPGRSESEKRPPVGRFEPFKPKDSLTNWSAR